MDPMMIILIVAIVAVGGYFIYTNFIMDKFTPMGVEDRWKHSIKDNSGTWFQYCDTCKQVKLKETVSDTLNTLMTKVV